MLILLILSTIHVDVENDARSVRVPDGDVQNIRNTDCENLYV